MQSTARNKRQSGSPLANDFKTDVGPVSFTITAVTVSLMTLGPPISTLFPSRRSSDLSFASLTGNDSKGGGADENTQTLTITAVNNPVGGTVSIVGTIGSAHV